MQELKGTRIAIMAMEGFEESELTEPLRALEQAGATVHVISKKRGQIQGFRHFEKGSAVPVERTFDEVKLEDYDGLMLPGGALNADTLRMEPRVREFIRATNDAGKPIAAICHAPWALISAGVVRGRKLAAYWTIQDDIRNAGGTWLDQECVVDDNWVTSRQPSDLPVFNREMIALFARIPAGRRH
ncbi:MAG TPA: type 1 glutamine amidotransferase domain-containing protein [Bryobacteraceae bacterium]|nr:type 1 glutamine amidotransferase domain-containing protein [Bryobacteraceae bacterium]